MTDTTMIPNDTRLKDLMAEAREYGRDAAEGKDSLPKLAIRAVRASNDGVITTQKDKKGVDDAQRLYGEYADAMGKKEIHEHTENGKKANESKLRQLIAFGALTVCDPVEVLDRAVELRRQMEAAKDPVKSAYAGYVDVAREQIKTDRALDDEELKTALRKKESDEPTVERVLERIKKQLDQLITGEKGLKDTSEQILGAHKLINERLAAFATERKLAEVMASAAELGITVVKPEAEAEAEIYLAA